MTQAGTSMIAYRSIQPELSDKQQVVYDYLAMYPSSSNQDLAELLGWPINTVTPRTKELRDLELIKIGRNKKKQDRKTGKHNGVDVMNNNVSPHVKCGKYLVSASDIRIVAFGDALKVKVFFSEFSTIERITKLGPVEISEILCLIEKMIDEYFEEIRNEIESLPLKKLQLEELICKLSQRWIEGVLHDG